MNMRTEKDSLEDESAILLLLCKLNEKGFQTKRLKLQKLVYLTDIFGTILEKKPTSYKFRVYKHGPFSGEIFADIERLVSKGLAQAKGMEKWDPEQERSFNYSITNSGKERIKALLRIPEFKVKEKAIELALQTAGNLTGSKIRKLVYADPNFKEAEKKGFGSEIDPNYGFIPSFIEIAQNVSSEEYGLELNGDEISWFYSLFLKEEQFNREPLIHDE
jgi:uncharacterized protein YwgA